MTSPSGGGKTGREFSTPGLHLLFFFYCRFPLLVGLVFVAFAPLAWHRWPKLLGSMMVLDSGWDIFVVALFATFTGRMLVVTASQVLALAPERFGVRKLSWADGFDRQKNWIVVPTVLPMLGYTLWLAEFSRVRGSLCVVAGVAVAVGLIVFFRRYVPGRWLPRLEFLLRHLGPGYVIPGETRVHRHHARALAVLTGTLLIYLGGYFLLYPGEEEPWIRMPALAYLNLILVLAGWGLTGVSFFLDRFRIPILTGLVVLSFTCYTLTGTDHYFRVVESEGVAFPPAPDTAALVARWKDLDNRSILVVTASGGGIKASMWTARVLTGLQEALGREAMRQIRLISAVSGGSVGALLYLDAHGAAGPPGDDALAGIVERSGTSSLDSIGWGLAYPDLQRVLLGRFVARDLVDRGWALEQSWRRLLTDRHATLRGWSGSILAGSLPLVVFNATVVETGAPLLLSPIRMPRGGFARQFLEVHPDGDLEVVTAARLSATFPYVTPLARAAFADRRPTYHVGDGAYHDNYGVLAAVRWLDSLVQDHREELGLERVLLIEIRASAPPAEPIRPGKGWEVTTLGPLETLLNVRDASQMDRNQLEVELLRGRWEGVVQIRTARFVLGGEAPLSWRLSLEQKEHIHASWNGAEAAPNRAQLERVEDWLGGQDLPVE